VTNWNDHTRDVEVLAKRLKDTEVLVPIRDRTPIRASLIDRLDRLPMNKQRQKRAGIEGTLGVICD